MGTLLKYEFRRSRVIFLGIIGVTLLVELLYLVGWCFKLETPLLLGIIGGVLCLAFGAMAILLYGVIMFNDDISKKPGYLLFSTPRSAAQIVGAKLLMTLLALLGITVLFTLLIAVDVFLALQRNGTSVVALLSMFDASITESGLKDVLFNGYNFFGLAMYILNMVISFIFQVIAAYVVITLLKTVMGNQKGRTILAVILWFVIINAVSMLGDCSQRIWLLVWITKEKLCSHRKADYPAQCSWEIFSTCCFSRQCICRLCCSALQAL